METLDALVIDDAAARGFSEIVADGRRRGRRPRVVGALIALALRGTRERSAQTERRRC